MISRTETESCTTQLQTMIAFTRVNAMEDSLKCQNSASLFWMLEITFFTDVGKELHLLQSCQYFNPISETYQQRSSSAFKGGRGPTSAAMWANVQIEKTKKIASQTTFEIWQLHCSTHASFVRNHGRYKMCQFQFDRPAARCFILGMFFSANRCTTCLCT